MEKNWGSQAVAGVTTIAFNFVYFDDIASNLYKIRARFPGLAVNISLQVCVFTGNFFWLEFGFSEYGSGEFSAAECSKLPSPTREHSHRTGRKSRRGISTLEIVSPLPSFSFRHKTDQRPRGSTHLSIYPYYCVLR